MYEAAELTQESYEFIFPRACCLSSSLPSEGKSKARFFTGG